MDSRAVEVMAGLGGLFLFLSLVVTHLVEIVSAYGSRRGKHLADAIRELLGHVAGDAVLNHPLLTSLRLGGGRPASYIPSSMFAKALTDVIKVSPVETLDAITRNIPGDLAQRARQEVMTDVTATQAHIEQWYDAAMDRLSGSYRRQTQAWTFGIGAALVLLLNADAIGVAKALWQSPSTRAAAAAVAQKEVDRCQSQAPAAPADGQTAHAAVDCTDLSFTFDALPLGWSRAQPHDVVGWIGKVVGWLLSAVAISLGAPFWFDLLKRIAPGSTRMSGPAETTKK